MSDHERLVQRDPEVVEGMDAGPHRPADVDDPVEGHDPGLSPVVPTARGRRVLLWAWIPVAVVIGLVLWAALR